MSIEDGRLAFKVTQPKTLRPMASGNVSQNERIAEDRMPILINARHERFVQELTRGKSQGDAYLAAGYKSASASAAYAHAARLVRNGKVRARLNELQSNEEVKSLLTMERHLEELRVLREIAKANRQLSAAVRAEELRQAARLLR
jgi:phage terminase small subunit